MLYKQSKEYLLEKLKAAGLKSKPYTTQKGLEKSQESHIGAVLFESETLLRNGSKTRYRDQEGAQKKRRKVFDRALTFTVIIGDYTDEAVESMFGAFLSSLDRGIYVNGDYVPIEVEGADWVDKDDSILKAQVAVQIRIRFDGGLYRDTGLRKGHGRRGRVHSKERRKGDCRWQLKRHRPPPQRGNRTRRPRRSMTSGSFAASTKSGGPCLRAYAAPRAGSRQSRHRGGVPRGGQEI